MLSLKAHWGNSDPITPRSTVKEIESQYARWMKVLANDDIDALEKMVPTRSDRHWEYVLFQEKTLRALENMLPFYLREKPKFWLEFIEDGKPYFPAPAA